MRVACRTLLSVIVVLIAAAAATHARLARLYNVITLFSAHRIAFNFRSIDALGFPCKTVNTRSAKVAALERPSISIELPESFMYNGTSYELRPWLKQYWTTGLVVIQVESATKASLLYEDYDLGNTAESRCVSWSMCKSIISTLVGIAVDRGIIGDVASQRVTDYVPELRNSGYDGVRIKDVLQMSSGVGFNEDYHDRTCGLRVRSRDLRA